MSEETELVLRANRQLVESKQTQFYNSVFTKHEFHLKLKTS